MSKSLGNVIDPLDTMNEYGTDALRFTLCMGTAGQVCFSMVFCILLIKLVHFSVVNTPFYFRTLIFLQKG